MASTYTVNIGIEKPGTGDQSGTWGVTTNTNFDIIDQATNGVATVTLAAAGTSGSPNTLLINNGALSDGRNRFIQFNDGADLGATAYVQLDPNDAEKIVHIRNSLSGSRSLILFQGTYNASNDFEVPNGADVLVKFDGGGTGATVTDVNVNLTPTKITTGDLDVDNININGNTISSTDTNGNINITPNGSGAVAFTTNATFGDNDKAQFGAGNDLQIYHDAGHSRIVDAGTGNLRIQADNLRLQSADGVNNYITADNGGAATLYHNALAKLATSSIGVNVTGTVTADGLTVGDGHQIGDETTYDNLVIKSSTDEMVVLSAGGTGQFIYKTGSTTLDNGNEKMRLTNDGKLGIGTSGPSTKAHIFDATNNVDLRIQTDKTNGLAQVQFMNDARQYNVGVDNADRFGVYDATAAATRLTITSGGKVGISTTSPSYRFQIAAGTDSLVTYAASALNGNIFFDTQNTSTGASAAVVQRLITSDVAGTGSISADFQKTKAGALNINNNETNSAAYTGFGVGGSERMRIDSSGKVGIGTSSPDFKAEIVGGTNDGLHIKDAESATVFGGLFTQSANLALIARSNHALTFGTNDAERLRIDTSGVVTVNSGTITAGASGTSGQINAPESFVVNIDSDNNSTSRAFVIKNNGSAEIARFTESGRLGLGTPTPSVDLDLTSSRPQISFGNTTSSQETAVGYDSDNTSFYVRNIHAGNVDFWTNNIRRMRIDSSGTVNILNKLDLDGQLDLDVAVATNPALSVTHTGTGNSTLAIFTQAASNTFNMAEWRTSDATGVLFFGANGNVSNTNNSYGAISDIKLKENIADASSQWDDIKAVKVRKYSFKSESSKTANQIGVVAQELEASGMNGLVVDNIDRHPDTFEDLGTITKEVKYSVLYMKALKALQEAMTRIETLETNQAALEARIAALEAN